jgi:hypothetical protein
MRWLLWAWIGFVLGAFGGLGGVLALLLWQSVGPVGDNEASCGLAVAPFIFAPVIVMAGSVVGCSLCLLARSLYSLAVGHEPTTVRVRMTVASCCMKCGRHATVRERSVSALCPGCGEPLPRVPSSSAT